MGIIEASELPENEIVYLKKDYFGYRVVEPWRNPETKKINWINLMIGGKRGCFQLIVILVLLLLLYLGINELLANYKLIAADPCQFCSDCHSYASGLINSLNKISVNTILKP